MKPDPKQLGATIGNALLQGAKKTLNALDGEHKDR